MTRRWSKPGAMRISAATPARAASAAAVSRCRSWYASVSASVPTSTTSTVLAMAAMIPNVAESFHGAFPGRTGVKPDTPFDSVEGSHHYASLLAEAIDEAAADLEEELAAAVAERATRREEALQARRLQAHPSGGARQGEPAAAERPADAAPSPAAGARAAAVAGGPAGDSPEELEGA